MKSLTVTPIKTDIFRPGNGLLDFVAGQTPVNLVREKMILVVTSKIVSLAENRLVPKDSIDKKTLVEREADHYLGEIGYGCHLTIKDGLLIPSAGIDESNSAGGDYILFPEDPTASARSLWEGLRARWKLRELGVLMTDSHTSPLRLGVTGVGLAYWGFSGIKDLVGQNDLFGRALLMTKINYVDSLSAAAVVMMGEADDRQPLAVIHGAEVVFRDELDRAEISMGLEKDLYYPILEPLLKNRG